MTKTSPEYTILLIDDEPGIRNVLSITLSHAGFKVILAPDGDSGLRKFESHTPDIVITDIKMPGIDGIEVLKRIKDIMPETEVIIITGHGDMDFAVKSLQYEAADFITKPIDSNQLELSVQKAVDRISISRKIKDYMDDLEGSIKQKDREIDASKRLVAIGQTISGMSHVIKNIAGGLKGSSFILEQGIAHENREYLVKGWEMMKGNIDKITNLSLDLLNYAKTSRLNIEPVNPNTPALEVKELLTHRAKENEIEFNVALLNTPDPITMDSVAVNTALMNLVTNAMESFTPSPAKRHPRKVSLTVERNGTCVVYKIKDNGSGINQKVKEFIFNKFITTKGANGTGFGLMTTKKIVDEHHGSIDFKSTIGKGSTFVVRLPEKRTCETTR